MRLLVGNPFPPPDPKLSYGARPPRATHDANATCCNKAHLSGLQPWLNRSRSAYRESDQNAKLFRPTVIKTFVAEAMNEAMRLETIMRTVNSRRAVVVLHYAPIVDTVEGEPLEIYPFLGARALQRPSTASKYAPSCMVMRIAEV